MVYSLMIMLAFHDFDIYSSPRIDMSIPYVSLEIFDKLSIWAYVDLPDKELIQPFSSVTGLCALWQ